MFRLSNVLAICINDRVEKTWSPRNYVILNVGYWKLCYECPALPLQNFFMLFYKTSGKNIMKGFIEYK